MLPIYPLGIGLLESGKRLGRLSEGHPPMWYVAYPSGNTPDTSTIPMIGYEKTEADARAKMLIYLIENKLITV